MCLKHKEKGIRAVKCSHKTIKHAKVTHRTPITSQGCENTTNAANGDQNCG
jgi:hypothetical protein